MDYFERIYRIESALCELSTELALRLITGWHGLQLFDERFYQHLVDEGVLEEEDEDEENKMTRERAIEVLQEIAERESEYVASKDYASNIDYFAREENFMYACVYDKHNRYSSEAGTNMYYDDTYNVHTLTKKYGFDSVEDMMAYVFDRCELESEYSSSYSINLPNTMVFTGVPVSETELYIDKCSHEELFDYLLTLTEEERKELFRETDLVYHESSLCGEITSFSPTLYHGGRIVFFTSLPNAIQILESREA